MTREMNSSAKSDAPLLVACLCAQWCNTCCDYQATFWRIREEFPAARFIWVDIEDESERVEPVEIENFPTILISASGQPRFFGTVTPHGQTLRALIASNTEPQPWRGAADVIDLAQRLEKTQPATRPS